MADRSGIEWTDATWQPVTGCSVVSPGCKNCYAMGLAGTRLQHHPSRAGLTIDTKAGPVWNGRVRLNEQWLDQPVRWCRPRRIFVCAHGDLFHEAVPDEWIDRVFAVMAQTHRHVFQVLTKRPERMRAYMRRFQSCGERMGWVTPGGDLPRSYGGAASVIIPDNRWPLPNVWLGVSVEDQGRADERVPLLLDTPAAVRFASYEPALGPVDWTRICLVPAKPGSPRAGIHLDALRGRYVESGRPSAPGTPARRLHLIIAGGESGPGARPMHPDWARQTRDQCQAAGTVFFFKQWGDWRWVENLSYAAAALSAGGREYLHHSCGRTAIRVGKKRAGRLLDGVEHSAMPEVPHG